MKTRTAPWDYNRFRGYAKPDSICPRCSRPCYSGAAPDNGRHYTCPKCGSFVVAQIDPSLEVEAQADGLRARRNVIEEALRNEPQTPASFGELYDEMSAIQIEIERMYLPDETYADAKLCNKFDCSL